MTDTKQASVVVSVPAEPTMAQWDDFCAVFPVRFSEFYKAYTLMISRLAVQPEAPTMNERILKDAAESRDAFYETHNAVLAELRRGTTTGDLAGASPRSSDAGESADAAFETGDIVAGDGPATLHCGSGVYPDAVVVSARPLVLVSRECDMRWSGTVAGMKLHRVGRADATLLGRCMKRFLRDYDEIKPAIASNQEPQ